MNLIELSEDAESKIAMYRYPDLSEWVSAIDPILEAAGECSIGRDHIESIYLSKTGLNISTSFSSRCCEMSNTMFIPMAILTAENPIRFAKLRKLEGKIRSSEYALEQAKDSIIRHENALEISRRQYQELLESD